MRCLQQHCRAPNAPHQLLQRLPCTAQRSAAQHRTAASPHRMRSTTEWYASSFMKPSSGVKPPTVSSSTSQAWEWLRQQRARGGSKRSMNASELRRRQPVGVGAHCPARRGSSCAAAHLALRQFQLVVAALPGRLCCSAARHEVDEAAVAMRQNVAVRAPLNRAVCVAVGGG